MAKRLLVIDGADQGHSFSIDADGVLSIGSSRRNTDICLHDLFVRRVHCMLEVKEDRVAVRNSDDSPEIFVNGQPVKEQELRPGDVLRVGNSHLRLEDAGEEEADSADEAGYTVEDEEPAPAAPVPAELPRLPAERLAELTDHVLAHYEIGPALGRGHCGVVFRARDRKAGHFVALKVLPPEFPKGAAEMQQFVQAMKRVLALRHPHLVALYNAGRTGPYCWLALEYVEGDSLAQVLTRVGTGSKLNWRHALRLGIHVGRALDFVHQQRLVHGNVTPQNILIRLSDKAAKLGDLMLGRALDGSALQAATLEAKLLAEMPYLPPELADPQASVDNLSDIYGLGAAMYARLTGLPPFQGATPEETLALIQEGALVKPRKRQSSIPLPLEAAVVRMLARHQEDRYPSAAELVSDLERIAEQEQVSV
jgi:serine/threonine protein kinase